VGKMGFGEMALPRRRRLKRLIVDDKEGCGDMTLVESNIVEAGGHLAAQNVDSEVLEGYDTLVEVVAAAVQHVLRGAVGELQRLSACFIRVGSVRSTAANSDVIGGNLTCGSACFASIARSDGRPLSIDCTEPRRELIPEFAALPVW
jgi:hypothetical protein